MLFGCSGFVFRADRDMKSGVEGRKIDIPGRLKVWLVLFKFLSCRQKVTK